MQQRSTIKLLAIAGFALFTTVASATTLTINCSQITSQVPPAVNSSTSNCPGFGLLPGLSVITGLNMQYAFDFQFNDLDPGVRQVIFGTGAPGTTFDMTGVIVNQANRPVTGLVTSGNPVADYAVLINAFQVTGDWSANAPPITGITMDFRYNLEYTPGTVVPETTTFVLMGVGLLGLSFLPRRHRLTPNTGA